MAIDLTSSGVHAKGSGGGQTQEGVNLSQLIDLVNEETVSAKSKISDIQNAKDAISIGDMFEMQMMMNHLSQMSEMSSAVVQAAHSATMTGARAIK